MVCLLAGEAVKRSYIEVLVRLGQCMVDSMSLKKGNARLDGSMSQAHKANGCGVLGDVTNTKFHASALRILDSQSELRG